MRVKIVPELVILGPFLNLPMSVIGFTKLERNIKFRSNEYIIFIFNLIILFYLNCVFLSNHNVALIEPVAKALTVNKEPEKNCVND